MMLIVHLVFMLIVYGCTVFSDMFVPICVQSRTPALIFEYVNNTDFKVFVALLRCHRNHVFIVIIVVVVKNDEFSML